MTGLVSCSGGRPNNSSSACLQACLPLKSLAEYFAAMNLYALNLGIYGVIPFLLLFQFGYLYTGFCSLAQSLKKSSPKPLTRLGPFAPPRFSRPE